MAQASAFIHQLQLELDDTRQKLEEQVGALPLCTRENVILTCQSLFGLITRD